jgi:hypothetical protein
MRTDLSIETDSDLDNKHYINFDKVVSEHGETEAGGYVQVQVHDDDDITIVVIDKEGNVVGNIVTTVSRMIGSE